MVLNQRVWISLVAAGFLILWVSTAVIAIYRAQDGSNDFDTFYQAGKGVLEKTGIYYTGEYYEERSGMGRFLYPPITACFFSFFALFPMQMAAVFWVTFLLVLFVLTLPLILRIFGISFHELSSLLERTSWKDALFFMAISMIMLIDNLVMAQINILVFFLCLLALVLGRNGKSFAAGLVLSSAVFVKLTPIFFCLYFVVKKSWKLLAGVLVGGILFSALIPSLFFGFENNRIYHRQWLGRMVKPMAIDLLAKIRPPEPHPQKKSVDGIRAEQVSQLLTATNQSLEAVLMRFLLKDRHYHVPAQHYQALPVIGGGLSREALQILTQIFRFGFLAVLVLLLLNGKRDPVGLRIPLEVSLVFLTMTLLAPISRSHYFIIWIFVYLSLFLVRDRAANILSNRFFFCTAVVSTLFYLSLALPYGEAAGAGMWANLILWLGCAFQLHLYNRLKQSTLIDK